MVKIAYQDLNDPRFIRGLQKLSRAKDGFSPKTAYSIGKICTKIDKEIAIAAELYHKIALKHAVLNEDGSVKKNDSGGPFQIREDAKEAFGKDFLEWQSIVVEIDQPKLDLDALESARILPEEIMALECMLATSEQD
jgi:hypothetical protein